MPFTREEIRKNAKECGIEGFPKEFENWLISEHISTRDAYSENQVTKALKENKPAEAPAVKDSEEYKALKKEYEDFKTETANKETAAAKESAARSFFTSKGFEGKALDIAMRGSKAEISGLELGDDGKVKSYDALDALASGIYSGLVTNATVTGVKTATPPPSATSKVTTEPKSLSEALKQKYDTK